MLFWSCIAKLHFRLAHAARSTEATSGRQSGWQVVYIYQRLFRHPMSKSASGHLVGSAISAACPVWGAGQSGNDPEMSSLPDLTRMRPHASFMMRAAPDTLIELPAISLISARI